MNHRDDEIIKIKEILKSHPKGMTISEVSNALSLNRISTARYLESLRFSGQAEMRQHGQAKMYTLAMRVSVSSILDLHTSPMAIVDQELFVQNVNEAFLQTFCLKPEEVIGHNMQYTPLQPVFSSTFSDITKTVIEGKACTTEKSYKLGEKKSSFIVKLVPVTDENGQSCAAIILEDITTLKEYQQHLETMVEQRTRDLHEINERLTIEMEGHRRAKDAIFVSQQKYRALVEDMPAYACCYEPDGTLTYVNDNFCTFTQKDAGDLLGKSVFSLISPNNAAIVKDALRTIGHENSASTITLNFISPDTTTIWHQWTIRAFYDKRGKITEFQSIGIDITDRIEIEVKLETEEKKLDAIIRGSPLPQMVIGKDHRIISWNTAMEAFSGLRADQMIGATTMGNIFYDKDRPMLADLIIDEKFEEIAQFFPENCKKSSYLDDTWEGITFSKIHPGEGSWVFFTAAAIRDENGVVTHVVETMEDLVGYQTRDGTTFTVRPLYRMINKDAFPDP
jgi:PAS domain S-box-containing protein